MKRRFLCTLLAVVFIGCTFSPKEARAGKPDPVIATMLSVASTLLPLGVSSGLLFTGRGSDEGLRLDVGLSLVGVGSIIGPSIGHIYAGTGTDAWVTLGLRVLTGGLMTAGIGLKFRGNEDQQTPANALVVIGASLTALLAGYDFYAAYKSAEESHIRRQLGQLELSQELIDIQHCGAFPCATLSANYLPQQQLSLD